MTKRICVWLRRDLRLHDHGALSAALATGAEVACVFCFDTVILGALSNPNDKRVSFIYEALTQIDSELRSKGSQLFVVHGDPVHEIPKCFTKLGCHELYLNGDSEPYAKERDRAILATLPHQRFKDHVIFAGREVAKPDGEIYSVFTPYSKAWLSKITEHDTHAHPCEGTFAPLLREYDLQELRAYGFEPVATGLLSGRKTLENFLPRMPEYAESRDRVDVDGTSQISPHLRHGTISIRECVRAAQSQAGNGPAKWLSELIWREFYQMILHERPQVVYEPFQTKYRDIQWPGSREDYEQWCRGETGYPIVDAAMRCLVATGQMHNRLRMVTAMFLTKHLLCDYRWGEEFFAGVLLDFDLASNNGGWQWSASVGVDAQPYFRIMNPILQSRKCDPNGEFIRKWVPECGADPHEPLATAMVEHAFARDRALRFFQSIG